CRFEMGDLTQSNELARVLSGADCVLVNPPRRGLGSQLLQALETATPEYILYSSCNPLSLHGDLLRLSSKYTLKTIKPFDMFPLAEHIEGFCVLRRRPEGA